MRCGHELSPARRCAPRFGGGAELPPRSAAKPPPTAADRRRPPRRGRSAAVARCLPQTAAHNDEREWSKSSLRTQAPQPTHAEHQ